MLFNLMSDLKFFKLSIFGKKLIFLNISNIINFLTLKCCLRKI